MNYNNCRIIVSLIISTIFLYPQICFSKITNISNNEYNNINPSLYNGKIAWESNVDGDWDIYYWDGSTIRNISNNDTNDYDPTLYNGTIAWEGYEGIYYWDGAIITVIPSTSNARTPSLYDGKIAYVDYDGSAEIYYWDGSVSHQITNNTDVDNNPSLYNGKIAWHSDLDGDYDIYYWDGAAIKKVTNNNSYDYNPSLYNGTIAWEGDSNVYYWDGTNVISINNKYQPSLYNGSIAFSSGCCGNGGIFLWRDSNIFQVSQDLFSSDASLYNGTVAYVSNVDGNNDIYFWDGKDIATFNVYAGPDKISKVNNQVIINGNITLFPGRTINDSYWKVESITDAYQNFEWWRYDIDTLYITPYRTGQYKVTFTATDNFGFTQSDFMILTVVDELPPTPPVTQRYLPFLNLLLNSKK